MYTQYFGLTDKPFAIAPNPRYLYMSELHREALAHLIYGIQSDGCFILLTGDVGTGKTTVCRCLFELLPENTDIALILNPKLTVSELLKTICEELAIPGTSDAPSNKNFIDAITQHLLQAHAKGRRTALVIDEAQNLAADVLEQLRLLTNLETDTQKLLQIILLGQPELRLMLSNSQMAQVGQRITSKYHLKPLGPADVRIYIQHRLKIAGGRADRLFSDKAIDHIIKLSKGIPRVINLLCDRALLGAYAEGTDHVSLRIMKKAGREIVEPERTPLLLPNRYRMFLVLFILVTIGLSTAYYFLHTDMPPLSSSRIRVHPLSSGNPILLENTPARPTADVDPLNSALLQGSHSPEKSSPPLSIEEVQTKREAKKPESEQY